MTENFPKLAAFFDDNYCIIDYTKFHDFISDTITNSLDHQRQFILNKGDTKGTKKNHSLMWLHQLSQCWRKKCRKVGLIAIHPSEGS